MSKTEQELWAEFDSKFDQLEAITGLPAPAWDVTLVNLHHTPKSQRAAFLEDFTGLLLRQTEIFDQLCPCEHSGANGPETADAIDLSPILGVNDGAR